MLPGQCPGFPDLAFQHAYPDPRGTGRCLYHSGNALREHDSSLTIISTLPSAGLGALLTLMVFGLRLDVIGIIGIILLIGIVKENGIMLVDFALVANASED